MGAITLSPGHDLLKLCIHIKLLLEFHPADLGAEGLIVSAPEGFRGRVIEMAVDMVQLRIKIFDIVQGKRLGGG